MSAILRFVVFALPLLACWLCFATSRPNEWLLVISDGKLSQAGVGISTFINPFFDKAVTLPASIHKVSINAQQVSKEMQGVEVSGFIVWAVNRQGDGPFKCYKYLQGLSASGLAQASEHIKGMAESIIRHQVANLPLQEVIANRTLLREQVRSEMHDVVQGWGIWLETVEVTDIRVLSQSVFEDLQTEFRQELRAKAEQLRMQTERTLSLKRIESDAELDKQRAESENTRRHAELWAELALKKETAKVEEQRHQLQLQEVEQTHALRMKVSEVEAELERKTAEHQIELAKARAEAELETLRARLAVENTMGAASLRKHAIDTAKEIFTQLPLREVKLTNFGNGQGGLQNLIPGLAEATQPATSNADRK